ncbi:MAG: hypothetical protein ACJAX5_000039 [Patiriisocius sp.]|jgi:hypothetical protein
MFAFTDLLGNLSAAVGTLLLLARMFDAVKDPLMGYVVERTRTPWGKSRPWLLIFPLPLGLLTIAMFHADLRLCGLFCLDHYLYPYRRAHLVADSHHEQECAGAFTGSVNCSGWVSIGNRNCCDLCAGGGADH